MLKQTLKWKKLLITTKIGIFMPFSWKQLNLHQLHSFSYGWHFKQDHVLTINHKCYEG